ncbi:hypothetical protein PENSPDRAFT_14394 [Peniophora sp. CONT]|nr:hypothetical protein PENSPDRAFT_14394 [Peniophora sp. CONT]
MHVTTHRHVSSLPPLLPGPQRLIASSNAHPLTAFRRALLDVHATAPIITGTGFFVAKAKSTDGHGGSWMTREKGSTSDVRLSARRDAESAAVSPQPLLPSG